MESCYAVEKDFIRLAVKVTPGSSKSEIKETKEGRLRIRIAAAPEDNRANDELKLFLSGVLGCAKKEVVILSGEKSRVKTLRLPIYVKEKLEKLIR